MEGRYEIATGTADLAQQAVEGAPKQKDQRKLCAAPLALRESNTHHCRGGTLPLQWFIWLKPTAPITPTDASRS